MTRLEDLVDLVLADIGTDAVCTDYRGNPPEFAYAYAHLLSGLAAIAQGTIVEIGTERGLGTMALAYGSMLSHCVHKTFPQPLTTFEINEHHQRRTRSVLEKFAEDLGPITYVNSPVAARPDLLPEAIGLAFVDGDHSYEQAKADLSAVERKLGAYGKILLHDYHGPESAAENLKYGNGVTYAVAEFLHVRTADVEYPVGKPVWSAVCPGSGFVLLSRSNLHPLSLWTPKQFLGEIDEYMAGGVHRPKTIDDTPEGIGES